MRKNADVIETEIKSLIQTIFEHWLDLHKDLNVNKNNQTTVQVIKRVMQR